MEELLRLLITPLVTDIKTVTIEKTTDGRFTQFKILVPKEDIAKVIGKEGKMVKAIKNLLKIRAIKENLYANCEVQEK